MKIIRKIVLIIGILIVLGIIIICDIYDRGIYHSITIPKDVQNTFFINKAGKEQEKVFEQNFGNEKYKFPRENTEKIKLYKNSFLISRLNPKTIIDSNKTVLISFFNDPMNFSWGETTWDLSESEYILRFYDSNDNEIGKVWLCMEGCGMTQSIPFSPNMKYGGLSKNGKEKINQILNKIIAE